MISHSAHTRLWETHHFSELAAEKSSTWTPGFVWPGLVVESKSASWNDQTERIHIFRTRRTQGRRIFTTGVFSASHTPSILSLQLPQLKLSKGCGTAIFHLHTLISIKEGLTKKPPKFKYPNYRKGLLVLPQKHSVGVAGRPHDGSVMMLPHVRQ